MIIGNGIAGITAARHIRKRSEHRITVVSAESTYFFSRTALMYVYMGHMRFQDTIPYEPYFWKKNRIELLENLVESINAEKQEVLFRDGHVLEYDRLIIASGSKPRMPGIPGESLKGVQGLYHKQDLDRLEQQTPNIKHAVVAGGGLIGIELAEMLQSRGIAVTFLVRESAFWGNVLPQQDAEFVAEHLATHHGVEVLYEEEITEIMGDENGNVAAVQTKSGKKIAANFVGLTIGVEPNIGFLEGSGIEVNKGILVNDFLQTNLTNVYAIGDCAELKSPAPHRRAIEPVWYTGRMMGETVAATVCGEESKYQPGVWFNSAKFFDVEYQTYGHVPVRLNEHQLEYCWKHPSKALLMHFVFEKDGKCIVGVNTFGIRLRHELFDQWIAENYTIEYVLTHLKMANFDPEFFQKYEREILMGYNQLFGTDIQPSRNIWWRKLLRIS